MQFRNATKADVNGLLDFYGAVSDAMAGTPFDCLWRRGHHPDKRMISDAVSAGTLTVADDSGKIAAAVIVNGEYDESIDPGMPWLVACPPDKVAVIHVLAAAEDYRGNGIARELLLHVIDKARTENMHTVRLGAVANNTPAVKLYERCGFKHIIETRQLLGDTEADTIGMELPLA